MNMKVEEIKTHPLFEKMFAINEALLAKIEQDMREDRYDRSQPIILATWDGQEEYVCIDGHTRLQAARNLGIEEVPVFLHEFNTEDEALEKAIKLQRNRRNMTDAKIIACIEALDKKKPRGGDRRSDEAKSKASDAAIETTSAKSAKETADLLGVSTTKVERVRNVLNNGDPETVEAVKNGEKSVHTAYQETQKKRKKTKPKRNSTNATEKANNEGQELELADETKEPKDISPVFLSIEHFGALRKLGGSIEEHVANAIERYLDSFQGQHEECSPESGEENDDDDKYLNEQDKGEHTEHAPDDSNEAVKDNEEETGDDEEYFDPNKFQNEQDNIGRLEAVADSEDADENESEDGEEDDEEYFDPANYEGD